MKAKGYLLALGLAAAGSLLSLLALRQGWAQVATRPPAPLPSSSVAVRGQDLIPTASALALASLAALAAVVATRGVLKRVIGAMLAGFGAVIAVTAAAPVSVADVLAGAHGAAAAQGGSATAGGGPAGGVPGGSAPGVATAAHIAMVSFPWRWIAVFGALLVMVAGAAVTWRGGRWPGMSSRYERDSAQAPQRPADSAAMWDSLSRGIDPTESDGASRPPAR